MKRLHLHIKTENLTKSVAFYSSLFGEPPHQLETDYAKWLLDDPRAHISLSTHNGAPGIDHAGISIETQDELDAIASRVGQGEVMEESNTTCCYARSNKYWLTDPQGARWELFQTFGAVDHYGAEPDRERTPA